MKKLLFTLAIVALSVTVFGQKALNTQFFTADTITADTTYTLPYEFDAMYDYSIAIVCAVGANSTQVAKIYVQGSLDDARSAGGCAADSWYNIDTLSVASSAMTILNGTSTGANYMGKWMRIKYDVTTNGSSKVSGWFVAKKSID